MFSSTYIFTHISFAIEPLVVFQICKLIQRDFKIVANVRDIKCNILCYQCTDVMQLNLKAMASQCLKIGKREVFAK